ncbi:hypothetical protein B0H13DRAFT_2673278 [Mycena leptocephala]|nr:hypothetical protein B0H13DRAFT_2673278 [Mycena leptocephala]
MYGLSWAIRSKPEWQRKISDSSIVEKWRKEALDQQQTLPVEQKLTPNMINYVLTELVGHARLSDPITGIKCGPFDTIWYSDSLISNDVSDRLRAAVVELENIPDNLKDWHPGSNGQVLDLVHPSLYCIVYGQTFHTDLMFPKPPPYTEPRPMYGWPGPISDTFCWLPSDFSVDATDGSVTLVSPYINNLHPTKHRPLYPLIESVLSSFVPLFEHVLSQINGQDKDLFRDIPPGSGRVKTKLEYGTWSGFDNRYAGETVPCIWSEGHVKWRDGMTDAEFVKLQEEAPKVLPEAFDEYTGELEKTKIQNTQAAAGTWKYYDEANISESRLAFRVTTGAPTYHEQDDEVCMDILYGLKRDTHPCQDIGSIDTRAGRALAWPNIYQHRVVPFRLIDPSKPGHKKILAIFLIDPSIELIPSATNVPPQQADWVFDALEEARGDSKSLFSRLPPELLNLIHDHLPDTFMMRREAEEYRRQLMKERTGFMEGRDEELSFAFNMCEH